MSSGAGSAEFPILFPSLCGQIPDYTNANERAPHHLGMASGDALATSQEFAIEWLKTVTLRGTVINTNDTSSDALSMTYVKGVQSEIPNLVPLEVPNGTDLSALTGIKVHVLGR